MNVDCDLTFAVGSVKTQIVNECRKAIKEDNIQKLFEIIKYGKETTK